MSEETRYSSIIEEVVAERFRAYGYHVTKEPSRALIPFDLDGYRPDLIAKNDNKINLIIECKSSAGTFPLDRYFEISKTVQKHNDWKFIIVDEKIKTEDIEFIVQPFKIKAESAIQKVSKRNRECASIFQISEGNDLIRPSLVLILYANIEILLSLIAEKEGYPISSLPASRIAKYLYSEGEIDFDTYQGIRETTIARNKIAHSLEAEVDPRTFETLDLIQASLLSILEEQSNNV